MKNKKRILTILYITLALSLIAVWGQSCLSKEASTVNSDMVVGIISEEPVEEMKNGSAEEFLHYDRMAAVVRKIAHVIEYAVVGFQIMCILYLWGRMSIKDHVVCLYAGLTIALIDESIQILSKRGPLVSDLWIDLGGIILGAGAAFLVKTIIRRTGKRTVQE